MRMGEGVEWALHCCLLLAWVADEPVPAAKLSQFYDLPSAYLNKQLQALARAGIVNSIPGRRGGFILARDPAHITLMDVVAAIEGPDEAFQCTEIRQRGWGSLLPERHFRRPCVVAMSMAKAELAWRRALKAQTLADLVTTIAAHKPDAAERAQRWYETIRS
jgi:Rrf2 family protein